LSFCFTNNTNSNTKTLIVRMSTTSAAVSGGYAIMAANQTTNQTYTGTLFINNTSATTQQITNALGTFAATANVPAAGAIDTGAVSYININCNKVTDGADSVVLVAWTLEAFKGGVTYSG
jgi:hypothetical protein